LTRAAKEGWKIVYVAPAHTQAQEFRKTRRWIQEKAAKLPIGPVLARRHFSTEESAEQARGELLKELKGKFTGPMRAVIKLEASARVSKDAGLDTIVIGAGPASWANVTIKLK
jgi:hypothetical protein